MDKLDVEHFDSHRRLEAIPRTYGFTITTFSFIAFSLLNTLVISKGRPKSVDLKDIWKWRNLFISWIHALIVGTWDILCFLRYPELTTDLVYYHNSFLYTLVAFSTGYFLYDSADIIYNKKSLSCWEVLLHHLGVVSVFLYNMWNTHCIAYTIVALMAEISSIFLHARKLMQMAKVPFHHPVYKYNKYLNLIMFVIGRFVALSWIVYGMIVWYADVGERYMYLLGTTIFVMWIINIILFKRLVVNDILRGSSKARTTTGTNGVNGNSNNGNGSQYDKNDNKHTFTNGYKNKSC